MRHTPLDKEEVFRRLTELGIVSVEIGYDGSGDDGQIDSVDAFDEDGMFVDLDDETYHFLSDAATTALDNQGIDWYNSAGGFGTVTFNAAEETAYIEFNERYEAYETYEYSV